MVWRARSGLMPFVMASWPVPRATSRVSNETRMLKGTTSAGMLQQPVGHEAAGNPRRAERGAAQRVRGETLASRHFALDAVPSELSAPPYRPEGFLWPRGRVPD